MAVEEVKSVREITKKVLINLDLDESVQIEKFLAREEELANSAIVDAKSNLKIGELKYAKVCRVLKEKLEDAKATLAEAYVDISPKDVVNNASMDAFRLKYWAKIKACKMEVERVELETTEAKCAFDKGVADTNAKILRLKDRINKLK